MLRLRAGDAVVVPSALRHFTAQTGSPVFSVSTRRKAVARGSCGEHRESHRTDPSGRADHERTNPSERTSERTKVS